MKISFIIPFHNEEKNCSEAILRILNYFRGKDFSFEIIPVDDGSTDKTSNILKLLSKKYPKYILPIFRKAENEILGNSMGKALMAGTYKSQAEYIIWTMGDLSDDVKTYTAIITKLKSGLDLVIASRYMKGGSGGNLGAVKAFLSSWGTQIARLLFGVPVHDITNAFRGFKKEIINTLYLESSGFSISPEFAIKAHLTGFKIGEVPTTYTNRVNGVSSFKLFNMSLNYLLLYKSLFLRYKFGKNRLI